VSLSGLTRAPAEPVTQTQLVCPGPETLGVEGLPASPAQTIEVSAVSAPLAALPPGSVTVPGRGAVTISELASRGSWAAPVTVRGQVGSGKVSTAMAALVNGSGALAPGTVATQWSWTRTGNSRSFVTAACPPAAASSWLVAGGGAPGRLEHLVLVNPGPNPVGVDLLVLGTKGRVESPENQGRVLAGHARLVILLDAIAGSEPSPVVHVTARGGKVAAVLSETWLDGLLPRGGDDVVARTPPALEQVIAGVPINGRATLRIAVPGDLEAVVESRVLTPAGPRPLPVGTVTRVAGGSTRDLDLGSLPPGAYAVQVRADVPVVAAAMVDRRRTSGAPSDLAWSVASPPIRTLAGMALPAAGLGGISQRLDLAATRAPASVRVTTVGINGRVGTKTVVIGADSVTTLSLNRATSVWVSPVTGSARAAVVTEANDVAGELLSVTSLADLTLSATPVPLRQLPD